VLWGTGRTFLAVPYEILPPIQEEELDGSFSWLQPKITQRSAPLSYDGSEGATERLLPALQEEALSLGLELPAAFVKFMSDPGLFGRVPCCTGGDLELSYELIEDPANAGGRLLRFLKDSQHCLVWYLYVVPGPDSCVLVSGEWHDGYCDDPKRPPDPSRYFWCAPEFERFVCRFWMENSIWDRVHRGLDLAPKQAEYLRRAIAARPLLPSGAPS
jgi:hypothetical protein